MTREDDSSFALSHTAQLEQILEQRGRNERSRNDTYGFLDDQGVYRLALVA